MASKPQEERAEIVQPKPKRVCSYRVCDVQAFLEREQQVGSEDCAIQREYGPRKKRTSWIY